MVEGGHCTAASARGPSRGDATPQTQLNYSPFCSFIDLTHFLDNYFLPSTFNQLLYNLKSISLLGKSCYMKIFFCEAIGLGKIWCITSFLFEHHPPPLNAYGEKKQKVKGKEIRPRKKDQMAQRHFGDILTFGEIRRNSSFCHLGNIIISRKRFFLEHALQRIFILHTGAWPWQEEKNKSYFFIFFCTLQHLSYQKKYFKLSGEFYQSLKMPFLG